MKMQKLRLDDCWAAVAISNLDDFHDVGSYHFDFLNLVLPHCSKDQLAHIEKCTKDVDLSPITDRLWKSFFSREFGVKATEEEMKKNKTMESLKWSERFQRKWKEVEEDEKKAGERLKERYGKEASRKQSRQIRVLEKSPVPSNRSRSCFKKEGKLMSKLKKECMKSLEVTNVRAMKMKKAAAKSSGLFKKPRSLQAIDAF